LSQILLDSFWEFVDVMGTADGGRISSP